MKKIDKKIGVRERFHFWVCDCLGVVSIDEYLYDIDMITKALEQQEVGWKYQDKFNRRIGSILGLDPKNPYLDKQKTSDTDMDEKGKSIYG